MPYLLSSFRTNPVLAQFLDRVRHDVGEVLLALADGEASGLLALHRRVLIEEADAPARQRGRGCASWYGPSR